MFVNLMLVATGGAVGAVARYILVTQLTPLTTPVWATFVVNILGCGVAGGLIGYLADSVWFQEQGRFLLLIGLLGGFTTFSAFSLDFFTLMSSQKQVHALIYAFSSVACSVIAFWVAYKVISVNA